MRISPEWGEDADAKAHRRQRLRHMKNDIRLCRSLRSRQLTGEEDQDREAESDDDDDDDENNDGDLGDSHSDSDDFDEGMDERADDERPL